MNTVHEDHTQHNIDMCVCGFTRFLINYLLFPFRFRAAFCCRRNRCNLDQTQSAGNNRSIDNFFFYFESRFVCTPVLCVQLATIAMTRAKRA